MGQPGGEKTPFATIPHSRGTTGGFEGREKREERREKTEERREKREERRKKKEEIQENGHQESPNEAARGSK